MIDLHHRFDYNREDTRDFGCVCGSEWNFLFDGCSSVYPFRTLNPFEPAPDDYDRGENFECRKGHMNCGRH